MWNISTLCHRVACFAAWGPFLFHLLSPRCLSDSIFVCGWKGGGLSVFPVGAFIFHSFSFSFSFSGLGSPSPRPPIRLSIHSQFKHDRLLRAFGNEVSAHLWREDNSLQLLPHVGYWHVHMAPSVRPTGQTGEDQRLVSCAKQSLRMDPGWRLWHSSAKVLALKSFFFVFVFFKKCFFNRLIWRRQSASQASSLREPRTLEWCSLSLCLRSLTATMESRGQLWRRRTPAMKRSDKRD